MPYVLIALFVTLISVLLIRTFSFKPNLFPTMKRHQQLDENRIKQSLSEMIQFKTVSSLDDKKIDQKAFASFRDYVKFRYPTICSSANYQEMGSAMLFHLKGKSDRFPIVMMAHYDVVPAKGVWQDDPFSGKITEDRIIGRGALDTKNSLCAVMEATEWLLNQNHVFEHDLYLAFSGDEEIGGPSAPMIRDYFKANNITPYLVLDEGGAIVSNMFPGVKQKSAVIGLSEKGFLILKLSAFSKGGHASAPPLVTPLSQLANAIVRLNKDRTFKMKITPVVGTMFDTIARHSESFAIRMLFANLWLFSPIVKWIAKKNGGPFMALLKTTQAFTMAEGSDAINVLPNQASIGIDYRLRPGESVDAVLTRIRRIINDETLKIEVIAQFDSPKESVMDEGYERLKEAINRTWPDVIVSPYLMTATSDSRHYHAISERVFKFSPMDVSKTDLAMIHGDDESITIENLMNGVQFYINLLSQF